DDKEIAYLVAVCSQREDGAAGSDSLLLDLSEVAFRGLPHRERWQTASLSSEPGADGGDPLVLQEHVEYTPGFSLEVTIDPPREVSRLRWDPLEGRLCRIWLRQVLCEDSEGIVSPIDLGQVTSNGRRCPDGAHQFETLDPMIHLPIAGRVARVTIEGE